MRRRCGSPRLDEILPRHLERGLDRLGPAADQIDVAQARRRVRDEPVGEPLGGLRGEEGGVGVGERVELPAQRRDDLRVAMAEAGDRRAARGVEIAPALGVDDLDAGAEDRDRQVGVCGAMQNMRHSIDPDRAEGANHRLRKDWRKGGGVTGAGGAEGSDDCGRPERRAQDQGRPS